MLIREYKESDLDALRAMHASQGFDYPFPDLADPIFVSKLVLEDDSGRAVMASLARLTCEMYLLVDRSDDPATPARWSRCHSEEPADRQAGSAAREVDGATKNPSSAGASGGEILRFAQNDMRRKGVPLSRQRYEWLLALHAAGERDLFARGLDDAHAWLPPPVARRFGRRLEALGWVRDDAWTPYCRRLRAF